MANETLKNNKQMIKSFFASLFSGIGLVVSSFGFINRNKMRYSYIFIVILAVLWMVAGRWVASTGRDFIMDERGAALLSSPVAPPWLQ